MSMTDSQQRGAELTMLLENDSKLFNCFSINLQVSNEKKIFISHISQKKLQKVCDKNLYIYIY